MKRLIEFFRQVKSSNDEMKQIESIVGNENILLVKRLSTETTLTIRQSVDVLIFYNYNINKCFDMCSFATSCLRDPYEVFLGIEHISKSNAPTANILTTKELKPKPLTWKQRINSLTNRK